MFKANNLLQQQVVKTTWKSGEKPRFGTVWPTPPPPPPPTQTPAPPPHPKPNNNKKQKQNKKRAGSPCFGPLGPPPPPPPLEKSWVRPCYVKTFLDTNMTRTDEAITTEDSSSALIGGCQYCVAKICNTSPTANAHELQNDPFISYLYQARNTRCYITCFGALGDKVSNTSKYGMKLERFWNKFGTMLLH